MERKKGLDVDVLFHPTKNLCSKIKSDIISPIDRNIRNGPFTTFGLQNLKFMNYIFVHINQATENFVRRISKLKNCDRIGKAWSSKIVKGPAGIPFRNLLNETYGTNCVYNIDKENLKT